MAISGIGPGATYPQTGVGFGDAIAQGTDGVLEFASGFAITGINIEVTADDGGWEIVAEGLFELSPNMRVFIDDPVTGESWATYSGIVGNGDLCVSEDFVTVSFIVPPMKTNTDITKYDVRIVTEDGLFSSTLGAILRVIHRDFVSRLYSLRSAWPPPRDVGPYSIVDEDWDG